MSVRRVKLRVLTKASDKTLERSEVAAKIHRSRPSTANVAEAYWSDREGEGLGAKGAGGFNIRSSGCRGMKHFILWLTE